MKIAITRNGRPEMWYDDISIWEVKFYSLLWMATDGFWSTDLFGSGNIHNFRSDVFEAQYGFIPEPGTKEIIINTVKREKR